MLSLNFIKHIDSENGRTQFKTDVHIESNMISGIYGKSGQGKSTLLNIIAGITKPDQGEIVFAGEKWYDNKELVSVRNRNIGYIFQEHNLFPHFTVQQNILFSLPNEKRKDFDLEDLLNSMGLSQIAHKHPPELSGGQSQRVAIARAIAQRAKLILLDEPFTGLDIESKHRLYRTLKLFQQEHDLTILLVTHDINDIYKLCDQVHFVEQHTLLPAISIEQFKTNIEQKIKNIEGSAQL